MSITEAPISPRIAVLQHDIDVGADGVLDAFWQEMTRHDTPLIEALEGDRRFALVTFLWRDPNPTANPAVISSFAFPTGKDTMTRIVGTDVWFRTYKVPRNTIEIYQFAVNSSNQLDPLNSRVHIFPDDDENNVKGWQSSIVELPDAPTQPWSVPIAGVPAGDLVLHRFQSTILGEEHRIWIYTPHGYHPQHDPYSLLVLFDGWFYVNLIPTPVILDNLIAAGRIPPLVTLFVGSLWDKTRDRDLTCYPPYFDFLTRELVPWVRQQYRISSNPHECIVGGASAGGLAAAFVGLRYPELFGNILSNSGYFSWKPDDETEYEWIARQYAESPPRPLQFYLDAGYYELGSQGGDEAGLLLSSRHMRNVLRAKGYTVHYQEFSGGHNPANWRGTFADGLLALIDTAPA